jgi:hypothetical protein
MFIGAGKFDIVPISMCLAFSSIGNDKKNYKCYMWSEYVCFEDTSGTGVVGKAFRHYIYGLRVEGQFNGFDIRGQITITYPDGHKKSGNTSDPNFDPRHPRVIDCIEKGVCTRGAFGDTPTIQTIYADLCESCWKHKNNAYLPPMNTYPNVCTCTQCCE